MGARRDGFQMVKKGRLFYTHSQVVMRTGDGIGSPHS